MPQQLTLNILGEKDQGIIDEFRFMAGEERTLKLQVIDYQDSQKWALPSNVEIELILSGTPADIAIANADITVDTSDRSIFSTLLTESQTENLITGLIEAKFEYDDGLQIVTRFAIKEHALKKVSEA